MKNKVIKILIIIVSSLVLFFAVDLLSIKIFRKPVFAVHENIDSVDVEYKGIFYNTFYCFIEDEIHIKNKFSKYKCPSTANNILIGVITDIKKEYLIVKGVSDGNYLKHDLEAHISLLDNPIIKGANNLIIGQMVKIKDFTADEIYPPIIKTKKIEIIYSDFTIVDLMEEDDTLVCAEALEQFYEDEDYKYSFSCIKSEYVIVKYLGGKVENIKDALKNKNITIDDLTDSGINFYTTKKLK